MIIKHERLVSVLLRPQGAGYILRAIHHAAALVVEAEHGGHAVAALAGLQGGRRALRVPDAARAGPRSGGKPSRCLLYTSDAADEL